MRTTFTLDDDVAAKLKEQTRKTGKKFRDVVNETLRLGLAARNKISGAPLKPFRVKARALGIRKGYSYDNIAELLDQAEGPGFR
jgi:hypothetical protein